MGILIVLRSIVFIICFSLVYVGGDRLESTEFPRSGQRNLREHNCTELYSVYNTEVERIQTKLKEYGQTYDIVVLNFTVNLDCIIDDEKRYSEMKYVRQFLVSKKGKAVLKYTVETVYFALMVFGFKSTILNVNLTPVHVNDTETMNRVFTINNFTEISKSLLTNTKFTDVCVSYRNEHMWNFLSFLFIPKFATFSANGLRCLQAEGGEDVLQTSTLVYAIYVVCFIATMHIELILDEIRKRGGNWKIYHKVETPFSISSLISLVYRAILYKSASPAGETESTSSETRKCVEITTFFWSLPIAMGYYAVTLVNGWVKNVLFLNDARTLDYIDNTYIFPDTLLLSNNQGCILLGVLFYACMLLYLRFAFIFTKSLDHTDVAFSIFQPARVFTHGLEQSKYDVIDRRKKSSSSSNFVKSYKQLFNCAYWCEVMSIQFPLHHASHFSTQRNFRETREKLLLSFLFVPTLFVHSWFTREMFVYCFGRSEYLC